MNKNIFTLIWDHRLGMLVPVSELTNLRRKTGPCAGGARRRATADRSGDAIGKAERGDTAYALHWSVGLALAVSAGLAPGVAMAQLVPGAFFAVDGDTCTQVDAFGGSVAQVKSQFCGLRHADPRTADFVRAVTPNLVANEFGLFVRGYVEAYNGAFIHGTLDMSSTRGETNKIVNVSDGSNTYDAVNFGQLSTTNSTVSSLSSSVSELTRSTSSVRSEVTGISNDVSSLSTTTSSMRSEVTGISNNVSSLSTSTSSMRSEVNQLSTMAGSLSTGLNIANEGLAEANRSLASLSTLTRDVGTLSTTVSSLSSSITTKGLNVTGTTTTNGIDNHYASIVNVADGKNPDDAVNVRQLQSVSTVVSGSLSSIANTLDRVSTSASTA
ncbi:ESPR-type extended signal peptide-containing protein, partial [Xanthomonas sp. SHU 166]|uniref:ESPR-type extended signal peptide-containing protein n=1 Tax=Xanthomonas sp. SHU 166 TaxID=1591170 RepID=UPI002100F43A